MGAAAGTGQRARQCVARVMALAAALLLRSTDALAHKPSDSYLAINVGDSAQLSGHWDSHLRELDFAIGLDADGDGNITWGEPRARHAEMAAYASARLVVLADGKPCTLSVGAQQVDEHTNGAYTVLPMQWACATRPQPLQLQ